MNKKFLFLFPAYALLAMLGMVWACLLGYRPPDEQLGWWFLVHIGVLVIGGPVSAMINFPGPQ